MYDEKGVHFFFDSAQEDSVLSRFRIAEILIDNKGRFWLGSWGGGLFQVIRDKKGNPDSLIRYHHKINDALSLPHNSIRCIVEDKKGRIWIGTGGGGLVLFHPETGTFTRFLQKNPYTEANQIIEVIHIVVDTTDHSLWLGTDIGLVHFRPEQEEHLEVFTQKHGLPDDNVFALTLDQNGLLWLASQAGICSFDPVSHQVLTYPELQTDELCGHGAWTDSEGWVFFANNPHYMGFHPDSLFANIAPPVIQLTNLRLFGKEVGVFSSGTTTHFSLKQALPYMAEIHLPYDQNIIEIFFAGLGEGRLDHMKYAYQLEGLSEAWTILETGRRSVSFSGLSPGAYSLNIRSSNAYGIWADDLHSWPLIIFPPWWQSWWAWVLYIAVISIILWAIVINYLNRQQLRHNLEMEAFEKARILELSELKSRFFANISHEFRTPLTLILGPVKQLIEKPQDFSRQREKLNIIQRNAQRLLELVNQILDINQMESGEINLELEAGDLNKHLRVLLSSFHSLAEAKQISFSISLPHKIPHLLYDRDKIEKVVMNLLSNAFKFTPDKGKVSVVLSFQSRSDKLAQINFSVLNTGEGISQEKLPHIFDRFYQADDTPTRKYEGSGIGLALTKELVNAMGGEIRAESDTGRETRFSVSLCLEISDLTPEPFTIIKKSEKVASVSIETMQKENLPVLLIVEDNPDMRTFLHESLNPEYKIFIAENGRQGLVVAQKHIPDLIISDVMMPEIDGLEFCRQIKSIEMTSHIPIILLTARADLDNRVEGYHVGADAYLTKPFNERELTSVAGNLVQQRKQLREKFSKAVRLEPKGMAITPADEIFLNKVLEYLESNYQNPKLSAELFAQDMNLSRMQLHRKLKALTDQSAGDLIRQFRMGKAKELLEKSQLPIGEIAYKCGFEDSDYFSRVFKKQIGQTPSAYAEKNE